MVENRLTSLQRDLLQAFFRHETRFFLTGGAALAGFHLGHRSTNDLDLFAETDVLEDGEAALGVAASELGATVERIRTAPAFRRRLIRRGNESVLVDLVYDACRAGYPETITVGRVRVDPPEEVLANKLCALLSRAEIRDLVDVMALEKAGFPMENALPRACVKDAGLTPAQLAYVLSEITIGDDASVPGGYSVQEIRHYLADLQRRLARLAFPESPSS
ncbi:MAG: nucleotidyl transferase AbiEii/AbiGii toxin family protein [Planctomycetota bacterium]